MCVCVFEKLYVLQIPGFYYDEKKKKYFKIQTPHSGSHSHSRESLQRKSDEEKRQKCLQQKSKKCFHKKQKIKSSLAQNKFATPKKKRTFLNESDNSFPHMLDLVNTGCTSCQQLQTFFRKWHVLNLTPVAKSKILEVNYTSIQDKLEHMQSMTPNKDCSKLLCLWSIKNQLMQRIQILDVDYELGKQSLDIKTSCSAMLGSFSKVVKVCWAPRVDGTSDYIMYSTMSVIGNGASMVRLAKVAENPTTNDTDYRFVSFTDKTYMCNS